MKKYIILIIIALLLTGCADSNPMINEFMPNIGHPAGFWRGIWHGLIAPFSFVGIMFGMDIGIYEVFNNGNWYNFGFLLGIGAFGGGCSCSKKK